MEQLEFDRAAQCAADAQLLVLVVDDTVLVRKATVEIVYFEGHRTMTACNG